MATRTNDKKPVLSRNLPTNARGFSLYATGTPLLRPCDVSIFRRSMYQPASEKNIKKSEISKNIYLVYFLVPSALALRFLPAPTSLGPPLAQSLSREPRRGEST
jgi:hypothetical protein